MIWTTNVQHALTTKRRGKTLSVGMQNAGKTWLVIAVENPTLRSTAILRNAKVFFENHGHAVVGEYRSLTKAMLAAEAFAAKWKKGTHIDKCGCKEIGK